MCRTVLPAIMTTHRKAMQIRSDSWTLLLTLLFPRRRSHSAHVFTCVIPVQAITHPFASEADWELIKLVADQDTLPKGLLDRLLAIFFMGGLTLSSSYFIHQAVDALPGSDFETNIIKLKPLPDSAWYKEQGPLVCYEVHTRPIVPLLIESLRSSGDLLRDPQLVPKDIRVNDHLVNAERYQELLRDLRKATALETAVLLPVIFHSGAFLASRNSSWSAHLQRQVVKNLACVVDFTPAHCRTLLILCADETPLTVFNSSSDTTQAYPVYMSNGLLPDDVPDNMMIVALLPHYSDTAFPQCSESQHAMNRCMLVWKALALLLPDFTNLCPWEEDEDSFLFLGYHQLRPDAPEAPVYATPLLWLAGTCAADALLRCTAHRATP